MAKSMKTGFTSTNRQSPLAPTSTAPGPPAGFGVSAPPPDRGILRRKGNVQAGDISGVKANRSQQFERQGARHRIEVPLRLPQVPEAAPTQANGRTIPSYPKMQDAWSGANFWGGSKSGG